MTATDDAVLGDAGFPAEGWVTIEAVPGDGVAVQVWTVATALFWLVVADGDAMFRGDGFPAEGWVTIKTVLDGGVAVLARVLAAALF